jgi:DNA-binding response OmpR family regulator
MYALLLADNPDEEAILSLALRRAGLAVAVERDLEHALRTWSERPADLVTLAMRGDPIAQTRRLRERRGYDGGRWVGVL